MPREHQKQKQHQNENNIREMKPIGRIGFQTIIRPPLFFLHHLLDSVERIWLANSPSLGLVLVE